MTLATHPAVTALALAVLIFTPHSWMSPILAVVIIVNILIDAALGQGAWSRRR